MRNENVINFTIEAIGKESGFNSSSTFFKSFKQFTVKTPRDYLERQLSGDNE
jgi:AraC-like DNA-binding protein